MSCVAGVGSCQGKGESVDTASGRPGAGRRGGEGTQKPGQTPGRVKAKGKNLGQSLRAGRRSEGGEMAIIFTTFNLISFYTKTPRGPEKEEH